MLGWFANILIVVGLWKLGNKVRSGFVWNGVGELFWIWHALNQQLYDLAAICVVFCVIAALNWVKWGRG